MKLPQPYGFKLSTLINIAGLFSGIHAGSKKLHLTLKDIENYAAGDGIFSNSNAVPAAEFNGNVAYAMHSAGFYHPSGYTSRTSALLKNLTKLGVQVNPVVRPGYPTDIGYNKANIETKCSDNSGLTVQLFPEHPVTIRSPESEYIDSYADVLYEYCKRNQISVIHAASKYLNGSAAALAAKRLGIASVYEMRGLWHLTRAFYYPSYTGSDLFNYCEKREIDTCRGVDHVITLSDGLKNWLVERGIPARKITVVGNAAPSVDLSEIVPQHIEGLRQKYHLNPGRKIVGYLGSVVEYEGLDRLIDLLAKVDVNKRPYLLIVGDGQARKKLLKQARKSGVESDVIFAGRISPDLVSTYYALFDVAALPRHDSELTRLVPPIKPFEIVAHGCPLLLSQPVAKALGSTLTEGFLAVDFDKVEDINTLIAWAGEVKIAPTKVPTWQDRAQAIVNVYQSFN